MEALREVIDQMSAYDQGVRDGKQSAAEEVARLRAVVAVVDEFAQAHLAYETMPPRPVGGISRDVVIWEQARLDLERRCYRANRDWSATIRERMALAGGGEGEGT